MGKNGHVCCRCNVLDIYAANFAKNASMAGKDAINMWDKYVVQKQKIGWDTVGEVAQLGISL